MLFEHQLALPDTNSNVSPLKKECTYHSWNTQLIVELSVGHFDTV